MKQLRAVLPPIRAVRLRVIAPPDGREYILPVDAGTRHIGSAIVQYAKCPAATCLVSEDVRRYNHYILETLTDRDGWAVRVELKPRA